MFYILINFTNHEAINLVSDEMSIEINGIDFIIFLDCRYFLTIPWSFRNSASESDFISFQTYKLTLSFTASSSELENSNCILEKWSSKVLTSLNELPLSSEDSVTKRMKKKKTKRNFTSLSRSCRVIYT